MRKVLAVTPLEEERYAKPWRSTPRHASSSRASWRSSGYDQYRAWTEVIRHRLPITVGDTFQIVSDRQPIPLDEVEPEWKILMDLDGKGGCSAATCRSARSATPLTAIWPSPTTCGQHHRHRRRGDLLYRMKRLSSGEDANPQSHQFASGRFGVTPGYLRQCRVILIKVAQGETRHGGPSPGRKVVPIIAEVRHVDVGTELQSPLTMRISTASKTSTPSSTNCASSIRPLVSR